MTLEEALIEASQYKQAWHSEKMLREKKEAALAEVMRIVHGHDCPQAVLARAERDRMKKALEPFAAAFENLDAALKMITVHDLRMASEALGGNK